MGRIELDTSKLEKVKEQALKLSKNVIILKGFNWKLNPPEGLEGKIKKEDYSARIADGIAKVVAFIQYITNIISVAKKIEKTNKSLIEYLCSSDSNLSQEELHALFEYAKECKDTTVAFYARYREYEYMIDDTYKYDNSNPNWEKKEVNCSLILNRVLKELGLVDDDTKIYNSKKKNGEHYTHDGDDLKKAGFDNKTVKGSVKDAAKRGDLKPGDIILYKGKGENGKESSHMNMFVGMDGDKPLFIDFGKESTTDHVNQGGKYIKERLQPRTSKQYSNLETYTVYYREW